MTKTYDQKLKSIILIGTMKDRRRKLTDEDKENIKKLHNQGESIHGIARLYIKQCSKRLIQFVIYPERLKAMQDKHAKEQHWKTYYNMEKLTKAKNNWAKYKLNIYKQNQNDTTES